MGEPGPVSSPEISEADGETVVDISGLTKRFGATVAVNDVDLKVRRGELLVLIGLSGAGKSTLLRCLNGLVTPTGGHVEILGVDPAQLGKRDLRQLRQRVGFIFQQFGLVGRLTALGNVLAGSVGRIWGPRYDISSYSQEMRRSALEQLDRVGLGDKLYQRADTLSGGQQQRVAIARTLFQHPEIVLADEPVASLDPESSEQVMEILFKVCREDNLTVMCSLHQVDLALGWADRMVGLRAGGLVLDSPAHSLSNEEAMKVYSAEDRARLRAEERHDRSRSEIGR
ncbi:MAG: phosphonate ABC transporter ATP-binding protein [Acidimicrobiia bacterium]|nr:phosphonate ABC transporter ATP-binding protein [Acidimicrobiia bacterium]